MYKDDVNVFECEVTMPISQALYSGVTGLSVNSDGMSVIANNIANANAKGFKRDRAEFEDLLSMDLSSGAGPTQIGRGSRLRNVRTIHTQGGLKVTDNVTDLAIQGSGFLSYLIPRLKFRESAGKFFTRVGSLSFDKDGYLSDGIGGRIQGYSADIEGELASQLTDVRIQTNNIAPRATSNLSLNVQLDSRSEMIPNNQPRDAQNPVKTSNFNNTVSVFDSQGTAHQLTTYLERYPLTRKRVAHGSGLHLSTAQKFQVMILIKNMLRLDQEKSNLTSMDSFLVKNKMTLK